MNINEALNEATQREDDDLWITYDSMGIFSLHVGPEPEFSQDAGLAQLNLTRFHEFIKELQYR